MDKKLLFIINPNAGRGYIKNKLFSVINLFTSNNYSVEVFITRQHDDAREIAGQRGDDFDLLLCSGGDGTLSEVITGVMSLNNRPNIGFLPSGTVNDFSSNLSIPINILKASQIIVEGKSSLYDIGSFNDKYFVYCAAFGAFTNTSYITPQKNKNVLGRLAYFLEGAMQLDSIKSYSLIIKTEEVVIEDDFIYGMITNSKSIGGFKGFIGKNVKLDDGLFEACFIRMPKNAIELSSIVLALMKHEPDPNFFYNFRLSDICIHSDESFPWTLDGEFGGEHKDIHIKNHRQSISFIKK